MKQIISAKNTSAFIAAGLSLMGGLVCTWMNVSGFKGTGHIIKGAASLLFVVTGIAAFYAGKQGKTYCILCISGLLSGMVGDIFLGSGWSNSFLCGLAAFALGHIFYCIAFALICGINKIQVISFFLICGALLVYMFLSPILDFGAMALVSAIYCIIISFMVASALSLLPLRRKYPWTVGCTVIGAILFMISDFVLMHILFAEGFSNAPMNWVNMVTYYIAQCLLALSCLKGLERR